MITKDEALELLERAVAEYGEDHVAEECLYQVDGAPGCLVGVVLGYLGVDVEILARMDIRRASAEALDEYLPGMFSPEAQAVLNVAQQAQDVRATWGAALAEARDCAANML